MQNQLNVPICLRSLSQSMRAHLIEAQLYSNLLLEFSEQEIKSQLIHAKKTFPIEFEGEKKGEAMKFVKQFCSDFVENQRSGVEKMSALSKQIKDFQGKYEESRKDIDKRKEYKCGKCDKKYATENGLHNHHKKKKCSNEQARNEKIARVTRNERANRRRAQQMSENSAQ